MSSKEEPAFPRESLNYLGITKRELFSAMAMQGLLSSRATNSAHYKMDKEWTASESVAYADALIEALNKEALGEEK